MSPSRPSIIESKGFTLLECMMAIAILVVGMMALALLMTRMYATSNRAHFMNLAATFASEKLEDLEHYAPGDAYIAPGGDLNTDTQSYFDVVGVTLANGTYQEIMSNDLATYNIFTLSSNGTVANSNSSTYSKAGMTFSRHWLIENNTPVNGVIRVTVKVKLLDGSVYPPVDFTMSAVRPCSVSTSSTTAC